MQESFTLPAISIEPKNLGISAYGGELFKSDLFAETKT